MSKECPICHAPVEDTALVCPFCGATLSTEMGWEDPDFWPNPASTRGKRYPSSTARGLSIALAVFCFLSAASTLLLLLLAASIGRMAGELMPQEFTELLAALELYFLPIAVLSLADAAFYVVFGILLLVKKNWKIALTITIYSGVWYVLGMLGGAVSGIPLLAIIGVLCTIYLRKKPETPENFI